MRSPAYVLVNPIHSDIYLQYNSLFSSPEIELRVFWCVCTPYNYGEIIFLFSRELLS